MKPRKSKRHFKKDTNAPKMPTRPYILFANEMRPQLRAEGKTMSFGFAREIGKLWAQLSKNDKQEYYRDFDSKFAIYKKKADKYKTTMNYKNYTREKAAFTAKYAPSSTKPAPDPNAPSRPGNPFIQFMVSRQNIEGTIKGQTAAVTMQKYSKEWKEMSDNQKFKFQKVYNNKKMRFDAVQKKYEKSADYKKYQEILSLRLEKIKQEKEEADNVNWQCDKCSKVYKKNGKTLGEHLTKCGKNASAVAVFQCGKCRKVYIASQKGLFANHVKHCDFMSKPKKVKTVLGIKESGSEVDAKESTKKRKGTGMVRGPYKKKGKGKHMAHKGYKCTCGKLFLKDGLSLLKCKAKHKPSLKI